MIVKESYIKGCFEIEHEPYLDHRGIFYELFNKNRFEHLTGIKTKFVQDNISKSKKGVLRGLHFQIKEAAQSKLVSVVKGKILDVAVDIRPDSPTFGKYFSTYLDQSNFKQLYIPRGCAHGFVSLEEDTIVSYKCDNFYSKENERGILFNDKTLNIDWEHNTEDLIISSKDISLPTLEEYLNEK